MNIAVGSTNPTKIQAVREAFLTFYTEKTIVVSGITVPSGVKSQPMSDKESIRGATTRAKHAICALKADFGVGLEGGMQKINAQWFDCGWIVIIDAHGTIGIASSIKIIVPPVVLAHVLGGMELGDALDSVFQRKLIKHNEGHFGVMTNGAVTRTQGYRDGVIAAYSRFLHPELFDTS